MYTTLNYSPNFTIKKRKQNQIKFIIFHYTGMKKESEAINRLIDPNSKVSSHYVIKKNGEIVVLVPDAYIAWHAGISYWKKIKSLNKNSIGVEIANPGHDFKYKKFSKAQINGLVNLSKFLIKKYKIKSKNILGHSDIAPERKKDPGEKFPWEFLSKKGISYWYDLNQTQLMMNRKLKINIKEEKLFISNLSKIGYQKKTSNHLNLNQTNFKKIITKAFQRRFRPEIIDGNIDKECLIISENLIKK